jgi:alkanesulfonate monooxygenase SsuD/methylene tetrahydromethanopterin reductase-like flavin-dependent oxidoreductase (luciferase family)
MITNAVVCMEDRDHAREVVTRYGRGYLYSLVCLYHDTIPKPAGAPVWPAPPASLGPDMVDWAIDAGYLLCGTPDEVCEQISRGYQEVGVDQLVFGVPGDSISHEETLEVLEVFGKQVIPEFDRHAEHSTTRYRQTATPKHAPFNAEPPDITTIWSDRSPTVSP